MRRERENKEIILAELEYWLCKGAEFEIGAMQALCNVLTAIMLGRTAEQHKYEIAKRDGGVARGRKRSSGRT